MVHVMVDFMVDFIVDFMVDFTVDFMVDSRLMVRWNDVALFHSFRDICTFFYLTHENSQWRSTLKYCQSPHRVQSKYIVVCCPYQQRLNTIE